ncbi:MAG TPA: hypothetical protein VFU17_12485 [Candidatus Limnocylindrales bacterium]|nr:hypothetical protein [Candidatus Limnocylindrales bacterium]
MIAVMPPETNRPTPAQDRGYWFGLLDEWGAPGRPYREIADWLTAEQGLSAWWAQKIIVEYEQARGLRDAGRRRDGTFAAGASRTIGADAERVRRAFLDAALRDRWLPGVGAEVRSGEGGRAVRLALADGTRLLATLDVTGPSRTAVALEQSRMTDPAAVAPAKAYWRERLDALRALLEQ